MSRQLNIRALDWDDTALIEAYDRGMTLKVNEFEKNYEVDKENYKKNYRKKIGWKVGDNCRAIYSNDNQWYEAKIIEIDDDMCTVEYLGYHEEAEVELSSLDLSLGKKEIKKQKKNAKKFIMNTIDEAPSEDDAKNDNSAIHSPHHSHPKRGQRKNETQMLDQSANYAAAENTFYSYNAYPMMPPCVPNAASCCEAQNSSLNAMMTAWYMAGYYTGLHQAQKGSRCCGPQTHY